ncbi:pilus assembly protein CpaE [Rathayibacter sp. ZW T2_19]|uniref:Pilus assembly protein CpaE n=1 Tax=Rathayibacter rubneri TaxID=2950106 RepID=A0A9X2DXQ2_9MICO|nr:pilus assembly protein CpaE [Rathayibacter rubneri]MCM6763095.1 pilus assembly protein CpaE [Rathayibacter rubneri]
MITFELARALRTAGVRWSPATGDRFRIEREGFDGDVFTVSDMTIEAHEYPSGTVLGFNGTTEWALDSVSLDDSLWLPREDQLRELLRGTFRSLRRLAGEPVRYAVEIELAGAPRVFEDEVAENAYAEALLALVSSLSVDLDDVDELV